MKRKGDVVLLFSSKKAVCPADKCLLLLVQRDSIDPINSWRTTSCCWDQLTVETMCGVLWCGVLWRSVKCCGVA